MYKWVQRVIFLSLNVFHCSCADLISSSSTERTVALSVVQANCGRQKETRVSIFLAFFSHLSLSFIPVSPVNLLTFSAGGLDRKAVRCAAQNRGVSVKGGPS